MQDSLCNLCVSLETATAEQAFSFLKKVKDSVQWVRITPQLFFPFGVSFLQAVHNLGYKIFLDLRLNDTPLNMAASIFSLKGQPIDMLSLQVPSGPASIKFSQIAVEQALPETKLAGSMVLYHLQRYETKPEYFESIGKNILSRYAQIALQGKLYSVLCTPYEFSYLQTHFGSNFEYVVFGASANLTTIALQMKKLSSAAFAIFDDSLVKHKTPEDVLAAATDSLKKASSLHKAPKGV